MVRLELQVAVLLVTSCLAVVDKPPDAPLEPLCQDLKDVGEWSAHKGNGLQFSNLLKVCTEPGTEEKKSEHGADDIVHEMINCEKIEHKSDTTESTKKEELDKCNHELNCKKRRYMEVAKLRPDAYHKEFPLIWRGTEVLVDSPPSETFIDSDPTDKSKQSCPHHHAALKVEEEQEAAPETAKHHGSARTSKMVTKGAEASAVKTKDSIWMRIFMFIKCTFTKC